VREVGFRVRHVQWRKDAARFKVGVGGFCVVWSLSTRRRTQKGATGRGSR
jgi:hypothetical protein